MSVNRREIMLGAGASLLLPAAATANGAAKAGTRELHERYIAWLDHERRRLGFELGLICAGSIFIPTDRIVALRYSPTVRGGEIVRCTEKASDYAEAVLTLAGVSLEHDPHSYFHGDRWKRD